ncbi:MAG TPA: hypothetical protein VJN93_13730 [Candidatus Acidoferrum sp.]|nr:hypothetical protein [Candidatus Acidoferrum sp.]
MRNGSLSSIRLFGLVMAAGLLLLLAPSRAAAHVSVFVSFGPPVLPIYAQPVCPGEGYLWTPGYWAWDEDFDDYYWVPGTWVLPPEPGLLWTPGYWGWGPSGYFFTTGYWGPAVGFYGGIDYGFGYFGHGYDGGRWDHDHFYYNREVSNVNVSIVHNYYNAPAIHETAHVSRVSYNGGNGGVVARPTTEERGAANQRHIGLVAAQTRQINNARGNRELRASFNHGAPAIAATQRPGEFRGSGVMRARAGGSFYERPASRQAQSAQRNFPAQRSNSRLENNARNSQPRFTPASHRIAPARANNIEARPRYSQPNNRTFARQQRQNQPFQRQQIYQQQQMRQRQQMQQRQQIRQSPQIQQRQRANFPPPQRAYNPQQRNTRNYRPQSRPMVQRRPPEARSNQNRQAPRQSSRQQGRPH